MAGLPGNCDLDPAVCFLHELDESKESLAYDMQELSRWLVDLSVIQLLEEKKLKKFDFIVTENYHIRLKEQTAKALIERIKLNMNAKSIFKGRDMLLINQFYLGMYGRLQTLQAAKQSHCH
jgi:CRISPR-associated protein Cas1